MKRKVERISTDLASRISTWDAVDTIALAEIVEEDLHDPYFFLSLDVYYRGEIPDTETRMALFSDAGAFESSSITSKDRFLLESVPVRIEYKDMARIERILDRTSEHLWVFRESGTYAFHRLETARVLSSKSSWMEKTRASLKELPDGFWQRLAETGRATMEHYLGDLTAAVMREDSFFVLVSSAGFIKSFLSLLYVLNREFEPSGRLIHERVLDLPSLPENVKGRLSSFLRDDPEFPASRKREIAELLAKSVVYMQ